MDKLLQDMEKFCSMTRKEREKFCHKIYDVETQNFGFAEQEIEDWEMSAILNNKSCEEILENLDTELQDMEDFFLEAVAIDSELNYGDVEMANIVEQLIVLDRELNIYNDMIA